MRTDRNTIPHDITLAEKVDFLKRTRSYPDKPRKVKAVETHMSWVFLAGNYAYKLKKPVRHEFLDFSTIDARHHDCDEEIRLNRRLAHSVYIGVLPLTVDEAGHIHLGEDTPHVDTYTASKASERGKFHPAFPVKGARLGAGKCQKNSAWLRDDEQPETTRVPIIDWLVKMRRLPEEKRLDHAIQNHTVKKRAITRVGVMLASFYKRSSPVEISPSEYRQRFETDIEGNLRDLTTPYYGLPVDLVPSVSSAQLTFLKRNPELFNQRVQQGKIIEAHGDLRPEHIFLGAEPLIIDSLEFKRGFRILDPVDELSFLSLECERLSAPSFVTDLIFQAYIRITGDAPHETLVHFYKSCRAGLRAKLAVSHLREPKAQKISKWLNLAKEYLIIAKSHMHQIDGSLA